MDSAAVVVKCECIAVPLSRIMKSAADKPLEIGGQPAGYRGDFPPVIPPTRLTSSDFAKADPTISGGCPWHPFQRTEREGL